MAAISKAEYLKRYMSDESTTDKKKKKKKKVSAVAGRSRIIDDDVDFKSLLPANLGNTLEEDVGDNDPTVAEFIDERPRHVQELEQYRQSGQWRIIGKNSKKQQEFQLQFGEVEAEDSPGRQGRHDSDSDPSPPRPGGMRSSSALPRQAASARSLQSSNPARQRHDSDSDTSPPRAITVKQEKLSPHRAITVKQEKFSPQTPSGKNRQRHDSDSDVSPPRTVGVKREKDSPRASGARHRHDSDSDASPPRGVRVKRERDSPRSASGAQSRQRHHSGSDASPPRKRSAVHRDGSPPRRGPSERNGPGRHDSDSDASPPRRGGGPGRGSSPPRRGASQKPPPSSSASRPRGRHDSQSSDESPPRRSAGSKRRQDSDEDLSPPRAASARGADQRGGGREQYDSDPSPPRKSGSAEPRKASKTLSGAKAGLSSSREMRAEAERLKRQEEEEMRKLGAERLGAGSKTVFRDKGGRRRDLAAEAEQQKLEEAEKAKQTAKFQAWGKGLRQVADRQQTLEDNLHEVAKPLARYRDDQDLDALLKAREREGDPMAAYMRKKKSKTGAASVPEKPRYTGPPPPPNRFGIQPGYRWDGVDRSNGFEKQVFAKHAERHAVKEEAYKWGVQDM